ncbi:MAG: hypothetical protein H5T69_02995 [Chloroflexi bacterium]|nr:hypothetical protein [Chloroflexota bacterium]
MERITLLSEHRLTRLVLGLSILLGLSASAVYAGPGMPAPRAQTEAIYLPFLEGGKPSLTLSSPPDGAILSTIAPRFAWSPTTVPGVEYLVLQIASDPGFTQAREILRTAEQAAVGWYQMAENLAPGMRYYWRAAWQTTVSAATRWPYSATWSFTTASEGTLPQAPTLTSPLDGVGFELPPARPYIAVQWAPVADALEYLVVAQEQPNAAGPALNQVDGQRYEVWVQDIKYDVRVFADSDWGWYVIARNAYGLSAPSETRHFHVD